FSTFFLAFPRLPISTLFPYTTLFRSVMPGVMIIEALAQAAAVLSFRTMNTKADDKSVYYFAGIDEARFKRPVVPGDQLLLEVAVERSSRGLWKFAAQARVGDALAAEAKILCTLRPI